MTNDAPRMDTGGSNEASSIRLFGQVLDGIKIESPRSLGSPFKEDTNLQGDNGLFFAWIYGFAFEGHYCDLARPSLFVVKGIGESVGGSSELQATGLPTEPPKFSAGIHVWIVDRDDLGSRLTVDRGPYDRILLEPELRGDRLAGSYSGAHVSLQGAHRPLAGNALRRSD